MKKDLKVQITEMFMAKAGKNGFDRCFYGVIRREKDEEGNPVVYGDIEINGGHLIAKAEEQWTLGEYLDDMVLLVLDKKIHDNKGVFLKRYGFEYHFN
jgi:hypothetical protein